MICPKCKYIFDKFTTECPRCEQNRQTINSSLISSELKVKGNGKLILISIILLFSLLILLIITLFIPKKSNIVTPLPVSMPPAVITKDVDEKSSTTTNNTQAPSTSTDNNSNSNTSYSTDYYPDSISLRSNGGEVLVGISNESLKQALRSDDNLYNSLYSGTVYTVPSGTKATIVRHSFATTEVIILSGSHSGENGWVVMEAAR
jgi:hypothetical protein